MKANIINNYNTENYQSLIDNVVQKCSNLLGLEKKHVSIIFVNNETIQGYNKQYRNKDYATDVLTFPDGTLNNLGDIIISLDKCEEQRLQYEHSFDRELGFLVVHGVLHTLGYDHQTPEEEATMNELQNKILHKAKLYR